jgi:E3 ubiquitin-protein ligase DOA10
MRLPKTQQMTAQRISPGPVSEAVGATEMGSTRKAKLAVKRRARHAKKVAYDALREESARRQALYEQREATQEVQERHQQEREAATEVSNRSCAAAAGSDLFCP